MGMRPTLRAGYAQAISWSFFAAFTLSSLLSFPGIAAAQASSGLPKLYTNEGFIEDAWRRSTLDVNDLRSVLAYVLSELPPRVHVYPTENYYYFYFYHDGVRYAGNFRFDVGRRDDGLMEFIYFKESTDWSSDDTDHQATLGKEDGVDVKKVAPLAYKVSFAGESVVFELNDLSAARPPVGSVGEEEEFLGPVADESGMRFFLLFDGLSKVFRYVLDETATVADELIAVEGMPHIVTGRRTGFAFFEDAALGRKLLVGVFAANVDVNNYLDGPFDQLPDNFLEGDELRRALLLARPDLDKPIDRLGIAPGGQSRESISPYLQYFDAGELAPIDKCGAEKDGPAVHACLNALLSE